MGGGGGRRSRSTGTAAVLHACPDLDSARPAPAGGSCSLAVLAERFFGFELQTSPVDRDPPRGGSGSRRRRPPAAAEEMSTPVTPSRGDHPSSSSSLSPLAPLLPVPTRSSASWLSAARGSGLLLGLKNWRFQTQRSRAFSGNLHSGPAAQPSPWSVVIVVRRRRLLCSSPSARSLQDIGDGVAVIAVTSVAANLSTDLRWAGVVFLHWF